MSDLGPLTGIVVVSLEQAVSAPFATRQLADLGARVIKVERPGSGDFARDYDGKVQGLSSFFAWANRSKESVELDLRTDAGLETLQRLISAADVFVQNLSPRAARRLGLDAAAVHARHRHVVAAEVSGYGLGGPLSDRKAYDLLVQAEAGVLALTGAGDDPAKVGFSVADIAAAMYLHSSILAALIRQARTEEGCVVSVSMLDAMAEWMSAPLLYGAADGKYPTRSGAHHAMIAPYGPVRCGDGKHVYIAVQNADEWGRLAGIVLQRPGLAHDERFASNELRVANRRELDAEIGEIVGRLTEADLIGRLTEADLAFASMNDLSAVWAHPQLRERDRFVNVGGPGGGFEMLRPPVDLPGCVSPRAVPGLGQHTESVLAWLDSLEERARPVTGG